MARSTYFDLGRSADARPGSESGYAQRFQCGNVVKRLIGTGMNVKALSRICGLYTYVEPRVNRASRSAEGPV
jgi:hypothetical protein